MGYFAGTTSAAPAVPVGSMALFIVAVLRTHDLSAERRLYWIGYAGVGCLTGLGMLCRG